TRGAIAVNFLAHSAATSDADRDVTWRARLAPFFDELGLEQDERSASMMIPVFGEEQCTALERARSDVVSFHLGLPAEQFVARLKKAGMIILSSATTVAEARWLEERGCDGIVAQGLEAGGHRGSFLSADLAEQCGTMALVPQIVDAVGVPVVATGGIGDARGVAAAIALGASAVQVGTAFLFCPEAQVPAPYREALRKARDTDTVVTKIYSGLPARVIANRFTRTLHEAQDNVVPFPLGMAEIAPLVAASLKAGSREIGPFWAGQAVGLGQSMGAAELVDHLSAAALA
ncbi:MAG: nitronate monooxygenase, partial [Verrucomicrobia bacterium]|nr:nitronate monooxygenase [Verrucomicrobiota bacterium]